MSDFKPFSTAVTTAFNSMVEKDTSKRNLFVVDVTGDQLWEHYLASFPEGSNPMFKERTEHDCNCCRNFIKNIGAVVYATTESVKSVWDIKISDPVYTAVADSMSAFIKSKSIKAPFIVSEPSYGAKTTTTAEGIVWNHFSASVPRAYLRAHNSANVIGERTTDVEVLQRSINEISDSAIDNVIELIDQNSLYRGTEFLNQVKSFKKIKDAYAAVKGVEKKKKRYLWTAATAATRFRNTVIGTLLCDISEGVDLERAVASYEAKVAPTNYKRTTALVTQKMIDAAKATVESLNLEESLHRRYATKEDISVTNVLFVDGKVKPLMIGGVFDNVKPTKKATIPEMKKVDTVSVETFVNTMLPKADSIEVFVPNSLKNNFVSVVAPVFPEAAPLFKWDNAFSWSYDGEVTDSIKERVKRAGGKVDGDVRVSLSWHNSDDLDLSVRSGGKQVYFACRKAFGAELDVDMNAGFSTNQIDPVENIFWRKQNMMPDGVYEIVVHNFNKRSTSNVGFEVEVEVCGKVFSFNHPTAIANRTYVVVGKIKVSKNSKDVEVIGLTEGTAGEEKWGISTEAWTPVDMVLKSPNCWGDAPVGNEHLLFILKGCANPEGTRGFYNEFLRNELHEHRKSFELLASSMKVAHNADQLSGIGISTTKKEELLVRVKGSVNRVIKIVF